MSQETASLGNGQLQHKGELCKPRFFIYLPNEGLQGEVIPSHIIWENATPQSIQISFCHPLKANAVFNSEDYEIHTNDIIIKKVELNGYIGLSFKSNKVSTVETVIPVHYSFRLSNGHVIEKTKEIRLFKPKLQVKISTNKIMFNPETGFVKGRIKIRNIGKGTMIIYISATEDSQTKIDTPKNQREFLEKFASDLLDELSKLGKEFPQFESIMNELTVWDPRDWLNLSENERNEYIEYLNKLADALANNKEFLQKFVETYAKVLARNTEFLESIGKFIRVYESMVSRDLILVNPLDEIHLARKEGEITLKIFQTDRLLDKYDEIRLPKFELMSTQPGKIPIYKIFEWG